MKSLADTTFFYFDMVVEYQYGDTMESNFEYLDKDFLNMIVPNSNVLEFPKRFPYFYLIISLVSCFALVILLGVYLREFIRKRKHKDVIECLGLELFKLDVYQTEKHHLFSNKSYVSPNSMRY
jgi:hypothetical protein